MNQKMILRGYVPILLLIVALLTLMAYLKGSEAFTSTGTIIQLETSHVPTPKELEERECLGGLYGCMYRWIPFGF